MFSSVKKIIQDAKKGKIFILVDDKNRENEGDLVIPASKIDHKKINFMATHGRGLICLAIDKNRAKTLNLSLMPNRNSSRLQTAFTISIEARKGVTEASVDIAKLSGCGSSGVICEIMNPDGSMAKGRNLFNYAKKFNLNIARIEDLIAYRLKKESLIKLKSIEQVKIGKNETYQVKIYENKLDGKEHIALIKTQDKKIVPRVRVISSNIVTSFLSQNKENLSINKTLNYYKKYKNCILIIIRDELVKNNINNKKGSSLRNYGIGAQILRSLKIRKMILISKSKKNIIGLDGFGIKIVKQEFIK